MNCETSSHHFRQRLHITFLPEFVLKNLLPARATESQGSSSPGPDGIGLELNTSDILDYSLKIMQSGFKIMKSVKRGRFQDEVILLQEPCRTIGGRNSTLTAFQLLAIHFFFGVFELKNLEKIARGYARLILRPSESYLVLL